MFKLHQTTLSILISILINNKHIWQEKIAMSGTNKKQLISLNHQETNKSINMLAVPNTIPTPVDLVNP